MVKYNYNVQQERATVYFLGWVVDSKILSGSHDLEGNQWRATLRKTGRKSTLNQDKGSVRLVCYSFKKYVI